MALETEPNVDPAVTPEASATPAEQTVETAPVIPPEGAAAPAEGEASAPAAAPAAEQETDSGRRDSKAERRIGTLTKRAKQAEETTRGLESENAALKQQLGGLQAPSDEEYGTAGHTAAVVEHATTKATVQGRIDANSREITRNQQAVEQERVVEVAEKVDAFSAKTPDYADSVQKIVHLANLSSSVMQLDNTPEVFYALSKDLNLAASLERLPETQRLIELGRLSAEVTVKPVTVSNAPPPVASAQSGTAVASQGLRDDMTMEEFSTWHDKQTGFGT